MFKEERWWPSWRGHSDLKVISTDSMWHAVVMDLYANLMCGYDWGVWGCQLSQCDCAEPQERRLTYPASGNAGTITSCFICQYHYDLSRSHLHTAFAFYRCTHFIWMFHFSVVFNDFYHLCMLMPAASFMVMHGLFRLLQNTINMNPIRILNWFSLVSLPDMTAC